ncbi:DsbA family protein [Gordonia hydrophobica]|uniref:Thioredoxin domain-containing protein n=1 Tax=Gordonia hydrophobica TaxID=40516 RepID=A0ABZ2TYW8_9ACTN|nr:thioredoxin domain-containing protein [Gordonia hydrophobica]MBM7365753.1 protein-disulfide isomerase [Gordonia hydrophobica]
MSRLRAMIVGAIAAVMVLAGCSVDGTAVKGSRDDPSRTSDVLPTQPAPTTSDSGAPITADGGFRVTASDDVQVVVTVIEDMACPACRAFESAYGSTLDQIASLPGAAVEYRIISFLDRMSDDEYSSRAANASYCVWNRPGGDADRQDVWLAFQSSAFRSQPAEGGPGLPDEKLISLAKAAGADDVADCITAGRYRDAVRAASSTTTSDPSFEGTPTVLVNGEKVDLRSVGTLLDTVTALLPD